MQIFFTASVILGNLQHTLINLLELSYGCTVWSTVLHVNILTTTDIFFVKRFSAMKIFGNLITLCIEFSFLEDLKVGKVRLWFQAPFET